MSNAPQIELVELLLTRKNRTAASRCGGSLGLSVANTTTPS
jgi:hypothetical protein